MKNFAIILFSILLFTSCTKEEKVSQKKDEVSPAADYIPGYLKTSDVLNQLSSLGATEVSQPTGWTAVFSGYNDVRFFDVGLDNPLQVYIWTQPSDPGFGDAQEICNQDWEGSGDGGCLNTGSKCKNEWEDTNGNGREDDGDTFKIVCCDDD